MTSGRPTSSGFCRPMATGATSARRGRARGVASLSEADRPGGRRSRLFRRAPADRALLRGFLGRRLGAAPLTRGCASWWRCAGAAGAGRGRPDGGDPGPTLGRAAARSTSSRGRPAELSGDGVFLVTTSVTPSPTNFWTSGAACWPARRSLSRASTFAIEEGKLLYPPVQKPYPPLYFGGSSPAGRRSRPSTSMSISPGVNRRASGRKDRDVREAAARRACALASGSACTSSCAKRRKTPGALPTI